MSDLVSVIVPVYNVEKYLERCVKTIIAQTYDHLEIILIDDGSTDSSGNICDRIASQDERIQVIHQKNQGLSAARNTGIDNCKGNYICFIDSDDYVHPDYVRYLYRNCIENDCEIAICGHFITEEDDYYKDIDWNRKSEIYSVHEILDMFYTEWHGSIVIAWNKLYRRDCIGNIRFDNGFIHEDEATTFKFLYNAKKIAFGKEVLYYYYSRPNSITGLPYNRRKLDILHAYENRLEFYKKHGEKKLYDRECQYYLSEILTCYYKAYYRLSNDSETLSDLRLRYRKIYDLAERSTWTTGRKLLYALCLRFPLLYGRLKRMSR